MVYRFRVTYEDHEDVYRDIEIKSSQSFLELHTAIQEAIGFDNSKSAAFYKSDDYWRKKDEISVENTSDDKTTKAKSKKTVRSGNAKEPEKKKTIADHIDNPHQRFVYVFDPEREWTFLLELLKIIPGDNTVSYPQCVKNHGTAPKQYKPTNLPPPLPEDEDEPQKEKDELDPVVLLNEETEGFTPLDDDEIAKLSADNPGDDVKESSTEDEDGESSEGFNSDDED